MDETACSASGLMRIFIAFAFLIIKTSSSQPTEERGNISWSGAVSGCSLLTAVMRDRCCRNEGGVYQLTSLEVQQA